MPDYLDDLVASVNGAPVESPDAVEPVEPAEPPGVASQGSSPGPAGGPQEPRPEVLEVPEEIRAKDAAVVPLVGAAVTEPAAETAGRAAGPVSGRMMTVMPDPEAGQGGVNQLGAIAGILGGIAILGLPLGPDVVSTKAIGSKI